MLRCRPAVRITLTALLWLACFTPTSTHAQGADEPQIGQPGKDVIWVPTPPELIERMLDLASVTARDYVVDLGSGDGRMVIAAARRGARALGVEYDGLLVTRSREAAAKAGIGARARFVQGDMYATPFGRPTALALFLLPTNLARLREQFLALTPGTRIVINTFDIPGWRHDAETSLDVCDPWCGAKLWIVPARVDGAWTTTEGTLQLTQRFQQVSGTLSTDAGYLPITGGHLDGERLSFAIGTRTFALSVHGSVMRGTATQQNQATPWQARRVHP